MGSSERDRVVIITGANNGIGYHMLSSLVDDGYRVAGLDITGENVQALRDTASGRVRYVNCDVSDPETVQDAISAVVDRWDRVDILVNNAAIATFAPFEEQSLADIHAAFDVNFFGYVNTIQTVLPRMRARGDGIIHNVCSGTALTGHPGLTGYASTKGAIEALTRSLQLELRHENVGCTLMYPPTTNTRMAADLGYPAWLMNDPASVGRKLARNIESTARVITPDRRTKIGLYLIHRFPSLWRMITERYVAHDG